MEHLRDIPIATMDQPVSLLIGADTPEAFFTLDEKRGNRDQPIAIKTPLGWTVQGPCGKRKHNQPVSINHISNADLDNKLNAMWKHDFQDSMTSNKTALSREDKMVMDQLKETQEIYQGRYRFGMPWNVDLSTIQSNYKVAEKRSMLLQRKLLANDEFAQGYKKCMDKFLDHDFARELNENEIDTASNGTWYIPHHAVINEKKKKVRVVFDCAAKHNGKSLNDHVY